MIRFRVRIIVIRFDRWFSFQVPVMFFFLQFVLWVTINGLGGLSY